MIARKELDTGVRLDDLPPTAQTERVELGEGRVLELLAVPLMDGADETLASVAAAAGRWVAVAARPGGPPPVTLPLYGCHVAWAAERAAVVGPPDRLGELEAAVVEFATRESELHAAEAHVDQLLAMLDADAAVAFACDDRHLVRRSELAARFREAVDLRRRLALLAPRVQPPPLHPPTLAAQVGERLRERSRLVERLDHATDRAELVERVYESCGQRMSDLGIARRQMGLEWAIVILLVIQTVLLLVDLLASRATS
jgi:hypothetical protein